MTVETSLLVEIIHWYRGRSSLLKTISLLLESSFRTRECSRHGRWFRDQTPGCSCKLSLSRVLLYFCCIPTWVNSSKYQSCKGMDNPSRRRHLDSQNNQAVPFSSVYKFSRGETKLTKLDYVFFTEHWIEWIITYFGWNKYPPCGRHVLMPTDFSSDVWEFKQWRLLLSVNSFTIKFKYLYFIMQRIRVYKLYAEMFPDRDVCRVKGHGPSECLFRGIKSRVKILHPESDIYLCSLRFQPLLAQQTEIAQVSSYHRNPITPLFWRFL